MIDFSRCAECRSLSSGSDLPQGNATVSLLQCAVVFICYSLQPHADGTAQNCLLIYGKNKRIEREAWRLACNAWADTQGPKAPQAKCEILNPIGSFGPCHKYRRYVFIWIKIYKYWNSMIFISDVGAGGSGGESEPQSVVLSKIWAKYQQTRQRSYSIFNSNNEILRFVVESLNKYLLCHGKHIKIFKIKKLLLIASCFSLWKLMSNWLS